MEPLGLDAGAHLVWGSFTRALALVLAFSLFSFSYQLRAIAGARGLSPLAPTLARMRRDFGVRAAWWWPTLFHICSEDWAIVALPACGAVAALIAARGGAIASPMGLAVAWLVLLSIDAGPSICLYPWDSLLLEAGFLALWLPGTVPLSIAAALSPTGGDAALSLHALALPSPLLAFAFRWLLFRVLVGFGKLKFSEATWADRFYIRGFIIGQPMVSPAGWLAYHVLPDAAWLGLLGGMAFIELVAPWALFVTGWPRVAAAGAIASLMVGIQLTGNFGYFNIITAVLCLPMLDHRAALAFAPSDVGVGVRAGIVAMLLLTFILPASLLQFGLNSWVNLGWAYWSGIYRLRLPWWLGWIQTYARALRELGHLRLVSAYGVFPPAASPPQRWALCYEASTDGVVWARYEMMHYISSARTPPRFIAPWHPRLDHALFYESFGSSGNPLSTLGHNTPYAFHTSANAWVRLQLRLLEGGKAARAIFPFFRRNPFPDATSPPKLVRVVACNFVPAPLSRWWRSGDWWTETVVGVVHPALSLSSLRAAQVDPAVPLPASLEDAWPLNDATPSPEDFWCESQTWRERAGFASRALESVDVAAAWAIVADVRAAAAAAVLELLEEAGGGEAGGVAPNNVGASVAPSPAARRRQRTSSTQPPAAAAADASAAAAVPATTPLPLGAVFDPAIPVAIASARAHIRVPLPLTAADAARRVAAAAAASAPIDPADAAAVFVWAALPRTVARLRARHTLAALARARSTLNILNAPLLRAAARAFDRPLPTRDELSAEVDALDAGALSSWARGAWLSAADMAGGAAALDAAAAPPPGATLSGIDGAPRFFFAGNDDASVGSAMASPLRWLMHAHRVMLEGGAAAHGLVVKALLKGDAPLGVCARLGAHGDALEATPRAAVFDALSSRGRFDYAATGTECGSFLLWALDYDVLCSTATSARRVASAARPPRVRSPPLPAFLPAVLTLMPRIAAHPELRSPIVPHADARAPAPARVLVPGWCLSADGAVWSPDCALYD